MLMSPVAFTETILINEAYYDSLLTDIAAAKRSIDLSAYIFRIDPIGTQIADALGVAVKRGVKVRVLVDGIGTSLWQTNFIQEMEERNINARIYHPFPLMGTQWSNAAHVPRRFFQKLIYLFAMINSRNHRKLCIIDSKVVYVSSANIDNCHQSEVRGGGGWRDTTVRLTGVNVIYLEFAFEKAWHKLPYPKSYDYSYPKNYTDPTFNLNFTWRQRRRLYRAFLHKIKHCQERIWITNAYFVPDAFILRALIKAAKRSVDVRILLSRTSDIYISTLVANTFYSTLIRHGVSIYEYLPNVLHAKILILDNWYSIGSSNLNSRSLKHDLEVDVKIQSISSKEELLKQFREDLSHSEKITITHLKHQSFFRRLLGRIGLFFQHWL